MAGLVPAIHVVFLAQNPQPWMPGTRPGMTVNDSADDLCRWDLWRERSRCHQPVRLLNDVTGFGVLRQKMFPVRVLHHLGAFLLAFACAVVDPAVHQRVELPG